MARNHYSRDVEASPDANVELRNILVRLNRGDILVVPDVGHLARRWADLQTILSFLADKGVLVSPRHTSLASGELPEVAFKRDLRRFAVDRARARGAYEQNAGRPKKADPALARKLNDSGVPFEIIVTTLGVSPRTLHRYFKP
jgi:DNA invertase Pin-like site-specific DNA recombinase